MEKMIKNVCGAFLVVALVVIPLGGMQQTAHNELLNQIVEQAHKIVDTTQDTSTDADKKKQNGIFEAAKAELVRLMQKIDLAAIDLKKIEGAAKIKVAELMKKMDAKTKIKVAQLMEKIDIKTKIKLTQLMQKIDLDAEVKKVMNDAIPTVQVESSAVVVNDGALEVSLLDQIVTQAKNIIEGPFELRPAAQKELARLMNDTNLDIPTKFAMSDDIEIIQSAGGMNITSKVSDAYTHLQTVVADRKAQLGVSVAPQGTMQQVIDYVSRKFHDAQQAVSGLWYGKNAAE